MNWMRRDAPGDLVGLRVGLGHDHAATDEDIVVRRLYLNSAVYYAQAVLEHLRPRPMAARSTTAIALHDDTFYLPKILDRIQKTAPKGADLTSWRY
jgi:hypothetical protein